MAEAIQEGSLTKTQYRAFHTKVKESLWAYDEFDSSLRNRILDYLVDGNDATCILEIAPAYENSDRKKFFKQQHGIVRARDRSDRIKLFGLFQIDHVTPGYFRRLGEIAGQIPEVRDSRFESNDQIPQWFVDVLVLRVLLSTHQSFGYYVAPTRQESAFRLQQFLVDLERDYPVSQLIDLIVNSDSLSYEHVARYLYGAGDWCEIMADNSLHVATALQAANANSRLSTLTWLTGMGFDFAEILPAIAELTVSSSKKVRPLALSILRGFPNKTKDLLVEHLAAGTATSRSYAAEAIAATCGSQAESILTDALKNEKGKRVRQTIEALLTGLTGAGANDSDSTDPGDVIELPPIEMPTGELSLPDEFAAQLREQFEAAFVKLERQFEKQLKAFNGPDRPRWMRKPDKPKPINRKELDGIINCLEGKEEKRPSVSVWTKQAAFIMPVWSTWTDLSKIHLLHVVRFMSVCQFINRYAKEGLINFSRDEWLETHRAAQSEPYGLREVDAAFATLPKYEQGVIAQTYLHLNGRWHNCLDWESEAVWPLYAEYTNLFRNAILGVSSDQGDYWVDERRRTAIRIAAMMPKLPHEIEHAMWSVALGEAKTDRPAARRALHSAKNRFARALNSIGDGKQGVRIASAEMLCELGDSAAIEPLKKALKKEKLEIVKGAMLQSIEQLGGDVDEFLGRRKQLLDAKKGLEKKRPKGMEWVPLDSLSKVRWAENNKPVAKEILQWWVIQSIQFKSPGCGPILRRSIEMCRKDDAAEFARNLLSTWIAFDTKKPTHDEVIAEATSLAARQWKSGGKWLQEYYETEENYRDELALQMKDNFLQSAIGQKGLLAIVSAAGDGECVKIIERFIRTYHGHRLAQSKSLLETLGWIEHPTAVQLLLSLGNRFRTKAIRKRAAEMVEELADRQGWTMDQLADRTIPDAGFTFEVDEEGNPTGAHAELIVDYGSRKFIATLGDDLQPVIRRDDGKQVKALPAAAKDDDPEMVKAAKKEFSAAKKTVKEVVKSQAERLYEAACIQRSWPATEWKQYLADHSIAGALCRRVVWAAQTQDEKPAKLFRPLDDGSLTDVNDNEFVLPDTDRVLVAHSSLLDESTEQAWKQHLHDYEIPELFKQFGRQTYRLPERNSNESEIVDFRGHMLTTYRLRSRANKLGWMRGDAEDGGSFSIYHKPFRSERVDAVVEFTGSYVPEEDIQAAITEFYFVPIKPNDDSVSSWNPNKLKLGKVPPVLLSECYNDVREMAAEGSGFDSEWQKKGLF